MRSHHDRIVCVAFAAALQYKYTRTPSQAPGANTAEKGVFATKKELKPMDYRGVKEDYQKERAGSLR